MTFLISIMAKFCPMHDLGPLEKESNTLGCFPAFHTPSSNLSGLNMLASSPHASLSRWIVAIGIDIMVPLGTLIPPSSSHPAILFMSGTDPYNLKVSSMNMLTGFSLFSMSPVGTLLQHSIITSSLAYLANLGVVLSRNIFRVSICDVVSCPAKKKILHSAMISSMLSYAGSCHGPSIRPSKSFPYPMVSLLTSRFLMMSTSTLLIFLSSDHVFIFFLVER
uniref:Uncharacterized protein n=1 Tax=Oryza brachyantha TaxID=4533 RepID=J3KYB2_ORYBR